MDPLGVPPALAAGLGAAVAFAVAGVAYLMLLRRHGDALMRERRDAESRLREEQKKLLDFAEVSSDWFWEMDAELRFTRFSGHILDTLGIDGSTYIGKTRREIAAAAGLDDERWQNHLATLDHHLSFQDFRYDLRLPDGGTMFISVSGRPVHDDDGRFMGYRGTGRDLTAEEHMRAALSESQERFRAVVENSPWSIFMKDLDGRYLLGNRVFLKWHDTTDEKLVGETPRDRFDPEIAALVERQDREARETDSMLEEEARIRFPDGQTRDLLVIKFPVHGPSGEVTAIGGINIDITARKTAEATLQAAQDRFDLVAGNLPVALYRRVQSADGRVQYPFVSAGIRDFLGFEADEVKRNPFIFQQSVHPDDMLRWQEENRVSARGERPFDLEFRRVLPTGEVRWNHVISRAHRGPQGETVWDGVILDITEQKRAEEARRRTEERMSAAIDNLQEGFALFDRDDRLIVANEEYLRIVPVAEEILARNGTFEELFRKAVETGLIPVTQEARADFIAARLHRHRNPGEPLVLHHSDEHWYLLKEARTPEGGTALTITDISLLKNAEEAARLAKERAELASRSKSEFLANMSHELRTPLNSIIGMSDVIRSELFGDLPNATYRDYAGDINASGRHLLSVITDILDIAKIESGEIRLVEGDIDIAAVVDECERMLRDRMDAFELAFSVEVGMRAGHLRGDIRRFRQIVLNLLSNAIKFTEQGGQVTASSRIEPGGELQFRVADTGIGIAEADIPKILEPFGQVDGIMTRPHEGSGLGLSLVKSLTESHDGELSIESVVGEGTAVILTFPPARVLDPESRAAE